MCLTALWVDSSEGGLWQGRNRPVMGSYLKVYIQPCMLGLIFLEMSFRGKHTFLFLLQNFGPYAKLFATMISHKRPFS